MGRFPVVRFERSKMESALLCLVCGPRSRSCKPFDAEAILGATVEIASSLSEQHWRRWRRLLRRALDTEDGTRESSRSGKRSNCSGVLGQVAAHVGATPTAIRSKRSWCRRHRCGLPSRGGALGRETAFGETAERANRISTHQDPERTWTRRVRARCSRRRKAFCRVVDDVDDLSVDRGDVSAVPRRAPVWAWFAVGMATVAPWLPATSASTTAQATGARRGRVSRHTPWRRLREPSPRPRSWRFPGSPRVASLTVSGGYK